jgi:hypothetical protein
MLLILHGSIKQCPSACAQGRRWGQLGRHLAAMWGMTLRALDDIKDSVRAAAAATLRSLRSATLRLADPAASAPADAAAALALMLPFLLTTGSPIQAPFLSSAPPNLGADMARGKIQSEAGGMQPHCGQNSRQSGRSSGNSR